MVWGEIERTTRRPPPCILISRMSGTGRATRHEGPVARSLCNLLEQALGRAELALLMAAFAGWRMHAQFLPAFTGAWKPTHANNRSLQAVPMWWAAGYTHKNLLQGLPPMKARPGSRPKITCSFQYPPIPGDYLHFIPCY